MFFGWRKTRNWSKGRGVVFTSSYDDPCKNEGFCSGPAALEDRVSPLSFLLGLVLAEGADGRRRR